MEDVKDFEVYNESFVTKRWIEMLMGEEWRRMDGYY